MKETIFRFPSIFGSIYTILEVPDPQKNGSGKEIVNI
jgi:hypothetical protein